MNLPAYIKPYPKLLRYLPISDKGFTTLVFKTIYLNEPIYNDLKRKSPNPLSIAVLRHEEEHLKKASFLYAIKFALIRDFRVKEELVAYKIMFNYLKKHGQTYDLDRVSRTFSGLRMLWAMSYEKAKELIAKTWEEA